MSQKVLSSALVILMISAWRDIGIDTAQSIVPTFKWGNILGDTAAVFRIHRYFLIQLRRWRPFRPCWSESLNACNKLLPKYIWLQNSFMRGNLGLVHWLDDQCFKYSKWCRTERPSSLLGRRSPDPSPYTSTFIREKVIHDDVSEQLLALLLSTDKRAND